MSLRSSSSSRRKDSRGTEDPGTVPSRGILFMLSVSMTYSIDEFAEATWAAVCSSGCMGELIGFNGAGFAEERIVSIVLALGDVVMSLSPLSRSGMEEY